MPDWCSVFLRGDPDTPLREAADALALMVFKNGNTVRLWMP